MVSAANRMILRIELWHAGLLLLLLGALAPARLVEPKAMLLGGLFMGINFFLLGYGVAWVLTPLASRKRIRAGVALLVLKVVLILGLMAMVFFNFALDAISFAFGFSSLLVAIVIETMRLGMAWRS
jgi:hypothetical protein